MMNVVQLFDEVALMSSLKDDTIALIKRTNFIEAIKRLIQAHDIILLNLDIQKRFKSNLKKDPIWDDGALSDLKIIRRELVVYYRTEFDPMEDVYKYSNKMGRLFHSISMRKQDTITKVF